MKTAEIRNISNNVVDCALNILARCIIDSTFSEYCRERSHAMAVVGVVQSFELFLKAKIFNKSPYSVFPNKSRDIDFINDNSINIHLLPQIFKKLFNIDIDKKQFEKIIKVRNSLTHFGITGTDSSYETLKFIFDTFIPILKKYFPNDLNHLMNCLGYWDEGIFEGYLIEQLDLHKIQYSIFIKNKFISNG